MTARRGVSSAGIAAIAAGAAILMLAMGVRQTFGLFLGPVCLALEIGREEFGLAIAVQNLLWGAAQPFAGAIADRCGTAKVLIAGALAYAGGLLLMASADSLAELNIGGGFLIGIALSCVSFSVVLGAVGRAVPAERRSAALGLASAGGSFGQFIMAPVGQKLIAAVGWSQALLALALIALLIAPMALLLARGPAGGGSAADEPQGIRQAVAEAGSHTGYWYLTIGFFVCGFQVVFIGVHLPAYLADLGQPPEVAAMALALIGFFNIIGTWACGHLGGRHSKKQVLALLYLVRSLVIAVFLAAPKTETIVLIFASAIGLLWLGTVPLTSGLVAQIFGVRHLGTLFGLVFFSHQIGSFLGVWLGGLVYDMSGSYDSIWIGSIILGVAAAALHLPISERPLRPVAA